MAKVITDMDLCAEFITPNEGYYGEPYDDGGGTITIGYGVIGTDFPNSMYQSMPSYISQPDALKLFKVVVNNHAFGVKWFTNWESWTQHQRIVALDICYQWGPYWFSDVHPNTWPSSMTADQFYEQLKVNDLLFGRYQQAYDNGWTAGFTNRNNRRIDFFYKKDKNEEPKPPKKPPKTENKEKDKIKENETPQQTKPKKPSKPKVKDKIEITSGLYYLRDNSLWEMGKNGHIMTRTRDYLIPNLKKKTVSKKDPEKTKPTQTTNKTPTKPDTTTDEKGKDITTNKPDSTNTKDRVKKVMKRAYDIPLNSLVYAMDRPMSDPKVSGWADCSGFVGWCYAEVFPDMWNGGGTTGALYTGSIYQYCLAKGFVLGESRSLPDLLAAHPPKEGDILNMSSTADYASGGASHVVLIYKDTSKTIGCGHTPCPSLNNLSDWVGGNHSYFCLSRPFQ